MITAPRDDPHFLKDIEIGLGAWQWGDRIMWGYGRGYGDEDVRAAFETSLERGVNFIDTAEIYGNGRSERLLGEFSRLARCPVRIATKYFPWPWRLDGTSVKRALRGSLSRIGIQAVDLYQIHWPTPLLNIENAMREMAELVHLGMVRAVGVSNFGAADMQKAAAALDRRGLRLASNQVHYSLLNRSIEHSGVVTAAQRLGVRLIAHSPLERGLLSGKYGPRHPPPGIRRGQYLTMLPRVGTLLEVMAKVGRAHGGKSHSQVALNWLICKGVLPIPGAKSGPQAEENAGAIGWRLTDKEVGLLDVASGPIER